MAGYKTFNFSAQPLWVTIYNLPGNLHMDWGEVAPGTWRSWDSGPYAWGSVYQVRGEWPKTNKRFDETIDTVLNGPNIPKPYVFIDGGTRGYWIRPCWRTVNTLDRPIRVSIYNSPGAGTIDVGEVPAGSYRDWFAGDYTSDTFYRLRAQSIPGGNAFDIEQKGMFSKGWGMATLVMKVGHKYEWQISDPTSLLRGTPMRLPMEGEMEAERPVELTPGHESTKEDESTKDDENANDQEKTKVCATW
jgi:hypothetical protein